jgi:ABC-type branched-subunit amino acid transport system ATPase component
VTGSLASVETPVRTPALEVEALTIRFGGVLAVHGVCLSAEAGQVTGLIGPNGAGKTTTFNACCGVLRPTEGTIRLFGEDLGGLGPAARAQRGLGRTFQRTELFESLSVWENVALGREGRFGGKPWTQLMATRRERRETHESAERGIELCGLERLRHHSASSLSTGQRRLVEMARVIAGGFSVLLLDEPSSGLDRIETEKFGAIVRTLVDSKEVTVLLVEHDMSLVMGICDPIYVLDFGELIFAGSPNQVRSSELVRQAYLGSTALQGQATGP